MIILILDSGSTRPVEQPAYDLAELVAKITDENRHGEISGHNAGARRD